MTLQRVIPYSLTAVFVIFILLVNLPSLTCTDPAGCIYVQTGDSISIGIARVSSGPGQKTSLEIQQSAELAISHLGIYENQPLLSIQPFYAPCLSDSEPGSSIEAAAANHVIIILGPACPSESSEYNTRLARSAKASFSPIATLLLAENDIDEQQLIHMAQQAADLISPRGYRSVSVTSSEDIESTRFQVYFCQALSQKKTLCHLSSEGELLDQVLPQAHFYISLENEIQYLTEKDILDQKLPSFIIALSRPQPFGDASLDYPYWIGPTTWKGGEFLTDYQQTFQVVPETLAGQLTYNSVTLIEKSFLEASSRLQDGSWMINRQAFQQAMAKNVEIYSKNALIDCSGQKDCILSSFSLFQLNGMDYR